MVKEMDRPVGPFLKGYLCPRIAQSSVVRDDLEHSAFVRDCIVFLNSPFHFYAEDGIEVDFPGKLSVGRATLGGSDRESSVEVGQELLMQESVGSIFGGDAS